MEVKSKHVLIVFKKIEKNKKKKKMTEKQKFLRKTSFRPNRFFLYGCNSKNNHYKYLKFLPHRNDKDLFSNDFKYLLVLKKRLQFKFYK
ncbi:Uncharacterized protein FWK35_00004589 [Aphis craccivora]|uniref:Uncharacterized protein n=1 Tax=Aphis craccivora TaxID=307492 RepID=A0A6G0ZKC4_APHCR|nr:Uncharacterized protein FWK35_00004589 [Aphis craccivora]